MGRDKKGVAIHWFRHGLRLHDNPSLKEALKNCTEFYPVFIFDGEVSGKLTFLSCLMLPDSLVSSRLHKN